MTDPLNPTEGETFVIVWNAGQGYHWIPGPIVPIYKADGSLVLDASSIKFTGAGVTVTSSGSTAVVDIPGGGGGGGPTGPAGGDLAGTYPNPTVLSVANVTTGILPAANQASQTIAGTSGGLTFGGTTAAVTISGTLATANQAAQAMGGDVSGTTASATVTGAQGKALPALATGYLQYTGSAWAFGTPAGTGITALTGDVTASGSGSVAATVAKVNGATVPAAGALTTGNVLQVSGASALSYGAVNLAGGAGYVTGTLPAGNQAAQTMSGDVTGTTAAATVAKLQGSAVSATAPTLTTQVLQWSGSAWAPTVLPTALPPSGAAGGDLGSTYPNPTVVSVANVTTGTLGVAHGGTGRATLTAHDVLIGAGTTQVTLVAPGTTGIALVSQGSTSDPAFAALDVSNASAVTGALAVANGGTGAATLAAFNVLIGNGTGAVQVVSPGTSGGALISQGTSSTPLFGVVPVVGGGTQLAAITAHNIIIGNGTGAATLLAPSATSGVPLVSAGASADPAYGTAVVAGGGTGLATLTAHAVMIGAGTSTVAFAAPGATTGVPLVSNGSSSDPSFTTASIGGGGTGQTTRTAAFNGLAPASSVQGDVLYNNGTDWVRLAAGSANRFLMTGGASANPSWSGLSALIAGANVNTDETQAASAAYGNLATSGPTVTLGTSTSVLVTISCYAYDTQATGGTHAAFISVAVSGATTIAAADANGTAFTSSGASFTSCLSRSFVLTGLTGGTNTFTMQYRNDGGTVWHFANRSIVIQVL